MAGYLTRTRNDPSLAHWRATWPRKEDFAGLPIWWNEELRGALPWEAKSEFWLILLFFCVEGM